MLYENYDSFDFARLEVPGDGHSFSQSGEVYIYIKADTLLFVIENAPQAEKILNLISANGGFKSFDHILINFFEKLIADDCGKIDEIEQEISKLETAVLDSRSGNYVKYISSLRKRILVLTHYYEQLLDVLDDLLQNENELLSEAVLRYFGIFESKTERRYRSILNLRDYLTQVREAYQAEVDIGLNNIMKIFTVLTAVFLPLTLLVGWYGMNLKMPEFGWDYAYPMVIALAVVIVLSSFIFFKKKKWF
jgi:magnesium transporter